MSEPSSPCREPLGCMAALTSMSTVTPRTTTTTFGDVAGNGSPSWRSASGGTKGGRRAARCGSGGTTLCARPSWGSICTKRTSGSDHASDSSRAIRLRPMTSAQPSMRSEANLMSSSTTVLTKPTTSSPRSACCSRHCALRGLYVIEDLHTSYWPQFGGAVPAPDASAVGLVKQLVDEVQALDETYDRRPQWGPRPDGRDVGSNSLHVYPGIVFIEKASAAVAARSSAP